MSNELKMLSDEDIKKKVKASGYESKITRYAPAFGIGIAFVTWKFGLPLYIYGVAGFLCFLCPVNWLLKVFVFGKSF